MKTKFKQFTIITNAGTFKVKAPSSKLTEDYAKVQALHWLWKQQGVYATELREIKGLE